MVLENNSIGKGIATMGIWFGIGAMAFSNVMQGTDMVTIAVVGTISTLVIWSNGD